MLFCESRSDSRVLEPPCSFHFEQWSVDGCCDCEQSLTAYRGVHIASAMKAFWTSWNAENWLHFRGSSVALLWLSLHGWLVLHTPPLVGIPNQGTVHLAACRGGDLLIFHDYLGLRALAVTHARIDSTCSSASRAIPHGQARRVQPQWRSRRQPLAPKVASSISRALTASSLDLTRSPLSSKRIASASRNKITHDPAASYHSSPEVPARARRTAAPPSSYPGTRDPAGPLRSSSRVPAGTCRDGAAGRTTAMEEEEEEARQARPEERVAEASLWCWRTPGEAVGSGLLRPGWSRWS